jgi:hypothetical protein
MNEWMETASEPVVPVVQNLDLSSHTMGTLATIAAICAICLLATSIWAVMVVRYTASHSRPA